MQAKFIVIEGLEGAGKTTATQTVLQVLNQDFGIDDVVQTREPGGTALAEKIRALVKQESSTEKLADMSELLLMYAARVQLVENIIKPALQAKHFVLGDRHDLSSQAYQGAGRGVDLEVMASIKKAALGDFKPDLTLYLDIDPQKGLLRAKGRGELDRIEKMDLAFFQRVHARYKTLANDDASIITIDANQNLDAVTCDIKKALTDWLSGEGYCKNES